MRLKLFRAPTVNAAITLVRRELGADALILSTRRVQDGVEVTAALEGDTAPPPALPAPAAPPTPSRLAWHGVPPELQARLDAGPLEDMLAAALRFGMLPLGVGAPPLLVTGPPGAGKTLTIARLATRLTLAGCPPLVVTADGRRPALPNSWRPSRACSACRCWSRTSLWPCPAPWPGGNAERRR
jgi:flagellar biosynthesis protein FlhF